MSASEIVLVLGAGASASSGAPQMEEFLDRAEDVRRNGSLDSDAQQHFDAVFAAIEELNRAHTKATLDTDNVEEVFAALEIAELLDLDLFPSDLGPAMRTVIARTIEAHVEFPVEESFVAAPADYAKLIEWIEERREQDLPAPTIITFNYDCACDYALWRRNHSIDYGFDPERRSSDVTLLKLHGSLNWVRRGDEIRVYDLDRVESDLRAHCGRVVRSSRETARLPISRFVLQLDSKGHGEGGNLAIVPPVWSKLEHYRAMGAIWGRAAQALQKAEWIVVCGYSLPATDQFFRHLYALGTIGPSRIKGFHVLDPNEREVGGRFRDLLGPQASRRFECQGFVFSYLPHWLSDLGS